MIRPVNCSLSSSMRRGAIQKALSIAPTIKRFGVLSQNPATTTADKRLRHESLRLSRDKKTNRLPLMLGKRVRPQRERPGSCRNTERHCAAADYLLLRAVVVVVIAVADFDFYAHPGMNAALEVVIAFCEVGDLQRAALEDAG